MEVSFDTPPLMDSNFGARLRAQRERQQISLPAIAEKMKIRLSLLEQLEGDQLASWPKGIFGRSWLRDYARAIGLEPEAVVREFRELHPDTPDDPFTVAAIANGNGADDPEAANRPPGARLRRLVTAAISAVPRRTQRDEPAGASAPEPPRTSESPAVRSPAPTPSPASAEAQVRAEAVADAATAAAADVPSLADAPAPAPDVQVSERRRGRDRRELSIEAAATLCSKLARALDWGDVTSLLADAAKLLDAVGIVVWMWDSRAAALVPSVAHGYSDAVLASLPAVRLDESNAIAAAFRSGESCTVDGAGGATGAVVVPSVGPNGCVGVLALEVRHGREQHEPVRAFAVILAAQLGTLLPSAPGADPSRS